MTTTPDRQTFINRLSTFPAQLEAALLNLSDADLTTHFLENEWSVAQNVHHLADSHMSAYLCTKLIVTEDYPTITPYDPDRWAEMSEASGADINTSLAILRGLHTRWVALFESLDDAQWQRVGYHPETGDMSLEYQLADYADHCDAHLDQIARTLAARCDAVESSRG